MTPTPAQDELRRQLAALERFLADPAAAGMDEVLLAPVRQQADALRQLLLGRGVQVAATRRWRGIWCCWTAVTPPGWGSRMRPGSPASPSHPRC